MVEGRQISGKDLGALALATCCDRCAWVKLRQKKLPYQIFPGIFSSIDAYCKHAVHGWFDRHGRAPPWLARIEAFTGYVEPPHWSKFRILDAATGITLTGAPDALLRRRDGTLLIADYKTARHTKGQDELLPMYDTQLNAYARIAEETGLGSVTGLLLIYMEPVDAHAGEDAAQDEGGMRMAFAPHAVAVPLDPARVATLLHKARTLFDAKAPPEGWEGCKDCAAADALAALVGRRAVA